MGSDAFGFFCSCKYDLSPAQIRYSFILLRKSMGTGHVAAHLNRFKAKMSCRRKGMSVFDVTCLTPIIAVYRGASHAVFHHSSFCQCFTGSIKHSMQEARDIMALIGVPCDGMHIFSLDLANREVPSEAT